VGLANSLAEGASASGIGEALASEGGYIGVGSESAAAEASSAASEGMTNQVVIGENMAERVIPYAKDIGADYYRGMPGYDVIESTYGKEMANQLGSVHNENWINTQMESGAEIVDAGPDFNARSEFGKVSHDYEMERMLTKNYPNYQKAFTRINKNMGGVPGLDEGF
jgi:hypothetical protein